jgi:hypothetical protein
MLTHGRILGSRLWLVEPSPTPPPPAKRQRGRQETSSDKLCVKALIGMSMRRLSTADALRHCLAQAEPVARRIRPLLTEHGRLPTRRPWERRWVTRPARRPALLGCLGPPSGRVAAALGRAGPRGGCRQYAPARQRGCLAPEPSAGRGSPACLACHRRRREPGRGAGLVVRLDAASGGRRRQRLEPLGGGVPYGP